MRTYINLCEGHFTGLVHSSLRGEDIFVSYTIDGDQIEWQIDGLTPEAQEALALTAQEIDRIESDCVEDRNFSF